MAKFPVCLGSVRGELRCTAGVRCGLRHDIRASPVLLPCESSGCHTERVSQSVWKFFIHSGNFGRVATCVAVCHSVVRSWLGVRYEYSGMR